MITIPTEQMPFCVQTIYVICPNYKPAQISMGKQHWFTDLKKSIEINANENDKKYTIAQMWRDGK